MHVHDSIIDKFRSYLQTEFLEETKSFPVNVVQEERRRTRRGRKKMGKKGRRRARKRRTRIRRGRRR